MICLLVSDCLPILIPFITLGVNKGLPMGYQRVKDGLSSFEQRVNLSRTHLEAAAKRYLVIVYVLVPTVVVFTALAACGSVSYMLATWFRIRSDKPEQIRYDADINPKYL